MDCAFFIFFSLLRILFQYPLDECLRFCATLPEKTWRQEKTNVRQTMMNIREGREKDNTMHTSLIAGLSVNGKTAAMFLHA